VGTNRRISSTTLCQDSKGNIWVGTNDRLTCFHPVGDIPDSIPPGIQLTGISLFNENINWLNLEKKKDTSQLLSNGVRLHDFKFSGLSKWYYIPEQLELVYSNNYLTFQFIGITTKRSRDVKYQYLLEGLDKNWSSIIGNPEASYSNLPHGNYTFKVKAVNSEGYWSNEFTYDFTILPPWWKTTWFIILKDIVLLFAGGMIILAIYYNRRQKFRNNLRIRNKIASDLHDDLGATLSSISIMSELVNQQVKDQSPQVSSLLEKIGNSSRHMIESVNDMVWAINPQNDSFENIIKRMRTFASEILAAKDIAFHFDFDKNLVQSKLKMEMRRNFYLIFKEAVNNLAKYSGASNAFVIIRNHENNLKMTIRDDGNGFEMNTVKAGNGLLNMQQRAEIMNARFNFESIPGKGTTIDLEFKNE
jgi:two-component sensor histidine kinase